VGAIQPSTLYLRGRAQAEIENRKAAERKLDLERNFLSLAQRVAKIGSWELDLRSAPVTATWSNELQ
jgi:hypothetical protein